MPFRRGDYRPFVRASIQAFDVLQSATVPELAMAVPYVNISQVDMYSGEIIGDNIMREILTTPDYAKPLGKFFPERPLISFNGMEVKTEQQYGYAYNSVITLEFTVNKPDVVFSADDYSAWRELLVEGNAFLLEYGWASNPGGLKNDLLNGVGFYDRDSGMVVQSRTKMLVVVVNYNVSMAGSGAIKVNMDLRTMGNLGLRQVSLMQELAEEFLQGESSIDVREGINRIAKSPLSVLKSVTSFITDDISLKITQAIQARLSSLDKTKGVTIERQRFVYLGDVLDTFIAPIIERMCSRIGYKSVDLFLGNFSKYAGATSKDFGSVQLAGRSIAEFPIPVKVLRESFAKLQMRGKLMRVESLIDTLLSMTRGQDKWSAETRFVPQVFPIARDVPEGDGAAFIYAIADAYDGSDVFENYGEGIPAEFITKEEVFKKLHERSIPVIEPGRVTSLIKDFNFEINPEPLQRSIFAERQLQTRKSQVQMVEMPDPRGLAGRAKQSTLIPFGVLRGSMELVGNFVFQLFSYVWIEFYGMSQVSGVYNIRSRVDRIEPGKFSTTVEVVSEGIDPFNTRRRLSASELNEERRLAEERLKKSKQK